MCNNHEGIHSGTVYYVSRIGDTILCVCMREVHCICIIIMKVYTQGLYTM
jgi:hypothetical protein